MHVVAMVAVVAAAALGGCRGRRPFGSLTPEATAPSEFDTGTGRSSEEMNPVHVARPASERPASGPAETTGTLTRPDEDAAYEARLREVGLPIAPGTEPLVVDAGTGEGGDTFMLVDTVLAEVNGEVITREDILGPLRPQMDQWRKEYSPDAFRSRCRQVIDLRLREEISRRLVLQAAEGELSDQEKEQIDLTLGKMLKTLTSEAGSTLALEEKLRERGSSLEEQRKQQRSQLLVQAYLRKKIGPEIHVTHSELMNRYQEVKDERYVKPTRVRLGLVMLKKSQAAGEADARALAEAVRDRAASGEDFARLARRYSQGPMADNGGDWGYITAGSFRVKAVDAAAFALPKGGVGPVVETDDAFYVVKALERQDGRTVPFTEVQDELEDEIRDRKYNEKVQGYIQDLYERGYVRVMVENL